jgi:hypothetical protein
MGYPMQNSGRYKHTENHPPRRQFAAKGPVWTLLKQRITLIYVVNAQPVELLPPLSIPLWGMQK